MFGKKKLRQKIGTLLLLIHSFEIFAASLVLDPNARHNTSLDKSATGVPIVNIATPNHRGVSVNEFLEYNIGKEGQVLNNADNVGRSHLAGLINSNPNLGPHQAAGLVVLQVNGSNRSQIEGYLEALSRKPIQVMLSNENGIYFNNAGTINVNKFTATTGKIKLQDGDVVGIDVSRGNIAIGPKGFDGTQTDYVNLLAKTLEMAGSVVTNGNLEIVAGSHTKDSQGKIVSKGASSAQVAIDASQLGGMYANQIKIISTDKGAGVHSDAFVLSKNKKLEITADGKVKVREVQGQGIDIQAKEYEQSELARSGEDIHVKAEQISLKGIGTEAKKQIHLEGNVRNEAKLFTQEGLQTKDLDNSGEVEAKQEILVEGNLKNTKTMDAQGIRTIGEKLENGGLLTSDNLHAKSTHIRNTGEILASKNIRLESQKVENNKKIGALGTITALGVELKNKGEILSNGRLELQGSNIQNQGVDANIASNVIAMENLKDFSNTGSIQGQDVVLSTKKDLLLEGNLHGENRLSISGKNIRNTGKTTGSQDISIQAQDFQNEVKLSSKELSIEASGNVKNKSILGASNLSIAAKNLQNEDLIGAEKNLKVIAKEKVENLSGKTLYAGEQLYVKAKNIQNEGGEILGKNVRLEGEEIRNHIGTIQAFQNVDIVSPRFQNIGEVEDLDKYDTYYETWDGKVIDVKNIDGWTRELGDSDSAKSRGSGGKKMRAFQRREFTKIERAMTKDPYPSLLFPKYTEEMKYKIGESGSHRFQTGSARIPDVPLREKINSLAKTTYAKVLAGENISIDTNTFLNQDGIVSAKNILSTDADKIENLVSVGDNPVLLKRGQEEMYFRFKRKKGRKVYATVKYYRYLTQKNDYGYVAGQPSILEGKEVYIDSTNLVRQSITEANGKVISGKEVEHESPSPLPIATGTSSKELVHNMEQLENILQSGKINTLSSLDSSLFTKNVTPSAKYIMETRLPHISLNHYYGSDYFLQKVGYNPQDWDRVRRLGDAFYENQLVERTIAEKLGSQFLNGKAISMKNFLDNASLEMQAQGLVVGTPLSEAQKNALQKDIVWYEYETINGLQVLSPKIYLSKNTRDSLTLHGRTRMLGMEGTNIQAKQIENEGLIGNKGNTYLQADSILNRNFGREKALIQGENTTLVAKDKIVNLGSDIYGDKSLALVSQGKIENRSTVLEHNYTQGELRKNQYSEMENIASLSSEGTLFIQGEEYTSTAAKMKGKQVGIQTTGDIHVKAQELSGEEKFGADDNNYNAYAMKKQIGSEIEGENVLLDGKNIKVEASQLNAKQDLQVSAQENIDILAKTASEYRESQSKEKKGFGRSSSKTKQDYQETLVQSNLVAGKDIHLSSGKQISIQASNLTANQDIRLKSKEDTTITSALVGSSHLEQHTKTGLFKLSGKAKLEDQMEYRNVESKLAAGGEMQAESFKNISIRASQLEGKEGIHLKAKENVVISGESEGKSSSVQNSKGGLFQGGKLYQYKKTTDEYDVTNNKESLLRSGQNINISGENVLVLGSDIDSQKDIQIEAKKDILIKSNEESLAEKHKKEKVEVGLFAKAEKLSVEAGLEGKYKKTTSSAQNTSPDESTLVANENILLKSADKIFIQGDLAAGKNIELESKKIKIQDSKSVFDRTEKELSARLGVSVELNFNNVLDTFASLKQAFEDAKAFTKLHELTDIVADLVKGDDLLEALDGKEDTINALNRLFAGPKGGSGKAGIYGKASIDSSKQKREGESMERTTLVAGQDIKVHGKESIAITGTEIQAERDLKLKTKDLSIEASQSTRKDKNKAYGISGEINVLNPQDISLAGYYQQGKSSGNYYHNSSLNAGNKLSIDIEVGKVKGANLKGKAIEIVAKKDFEVTSLQDRGERNAIAINASTSSSGKDAYSGGGGFSLEDSNKKWVEKQTDIIGEDYVDIKVGNQLKLTGSKISNEKNGKDVGNLKVSASEILAEDIKNKDNSLQLGANVNISSHKKEDKREYDGGLGAEFGASKREKVSKATIGKGIIQAGKIEGNINREIDRAEEIRKNVQVDKIQEEYSTQRKEWGATNEILSQNAGTLGNFIDELQEVTTGEKTDYKSTFTSATYKTIRKGEDYLDKQLRNEKIAILPTSGQYGGIVEQWVKHFKKDETPSYKIVTRYEKVVGERGEVEFIPKYEIERANIADLKPQEKPVIVFMNGMTEEFETSVRNAVHQSMSLEDIKRLKEGGSFEVVLAYNKTRGLVPDSVESILGKVFDGSKDSLGITTGVSKGSAEVFQNLRPDQKYEIRTYSQNNIITLGAFNILAKKGYQFKDNVDLIHTGSPVRDQEFTPFEKTLRYRNLATLINGNDDIGSNEAKFMNLWAGGISETSDVGSNVKRPFETLVNVPVIGKAIGRSQEHPLLRLFEDLNEIKRIDPAKKEQIVKNLKLDTSQHGLDKTLELYFADAGHSIYLEKDKEFENALKKNWKQFQEGKIDERVYDKNKSSILEERKKYVVEVLAERPDPNIEGIKEARDEAFVKEILEKYPEKNRPSWKNEEKSLEDTLEREKEIKKVEERMKDLRERMGE